MFKKYVSVLFLLAVFCIPSFAGSTISLVSQESYTLRLKGAAGDMIGGSNPDLNNDGKADFFIPTSLGNLFYVRGAASWPSKYIDINTTYDIKATEFGAVGYAVGSLSIADISGDGIDDVIYQTARATTEVAYFMGGDSVWNHAPQYSTTTANLSASILNSGVILKSTIDARTGDVVFATSVSGVGSRVMVKEGGASDSTKNDARRSGAVYWFNGSYLTATTEIALANLYSLDSAQYPSGVLSVDNGSATKNFRDMGASCNLTHAAYGYFSGTTRYISVGKVSPSINAFNITGPSNQKSFGSIIKLTDFNGDGADDIIAVCYNSAEAGLDNSVYVFYGPMDNLMPQTYDDNNQLFYSISQLTHTKFVLPGTMVPFTLGTGDINNDGISDVIIGAPSDLADFNSMFSTGFSGNPSPYSTGEAYVLLGRTSYGSSSATYSLSDSSNYDLKITASNTLSLLSVGNPADVNGDGYKDLILSEPFAPENVSADEAVSGYVYLLTTGVSLELDSLNGGQHLNSGATQEILWTTPSNIIPITGVTLEYSTDNGTSWTSIASNIANSGSYTWTIPGTATALGKVRVRASNALGITGSVSSESIFYIDATGPTISNVKLDGEAAVSGKEVTFSPLITASITSNVGLTSVSVKLDADTLFSTSSLANATSYSLSYKSSTSWAAGTHTLTITAVDPAGTSEKVYTGLLPASGQKAIGVTYENIVSNGVLGITYTLAEDTTIYVVIRNMTGREVKRAVFSSGSNGGMSGANTININLADDNIPYGMYYGTIIGGDSKLAEVKFSLVKKN